MTAIEMGIGPIESANGISPASPAVVNASAPKHVSIVIVSESEADNFTWLYESIEDEVNKFTGLGADGGKDLIFNAENSIKGCLDLTDILHMDKWALRCVVSKIANNPAKAAFTVAAVIKKTGNTYSASFVVIDNVAIAAVETLEASGPKNNILKASWEVVQRAFTPKEQKLEEAPPVAPPDAKPAPQNVELAPPSPHSSPAEESAFTQVDTEVRASPRPSRWKWPMIFGGSCAATAIAASVFGIYAKRAESDSQEASRHDDAFAKYDNAEKFALSANILFGISAAFAGGAVFTLVRNKGND